MWVTESRAYREDIQYISTFKVYSMTACLFHFVGFIFKTDVIVSDAFQNVLPAHGLCLYVTTKFSEHLLCNLNAFFCDICNGFLFNFGIVYTLNFSFVC